jgi:AcrR family transcriptional regulator
MTSVKPRRSDATRAAILGAARERFAAEGYERATIRAIAADAGIDPSMVMRYYGNKEKLFAAAANFDLQLPDVAALPREEVGAALVRHVLARWEVDGTMFALLRAGVTHEVAAEQMRVIIADQLAPQVAKLCPDPAQVPVRVGLMATQLLGFALCRFVLRIPPVTTMSTDEAVRWVAPTLQRYLLAD